MQQSVQLMLPLSDAQKAPDARGQLRADYPVEQAHSAPGRAGWQQ